MNTALTPEARADLLVGAMTMDQKIQQIAMKPVANTNIPGCDFTSSYRHVEGIPELAIPTLRMTNGPFGGGDCQVAPTSTGLTSALPWPPPGTRTPLPNGAAVAELPLQSEIGSALAARAFNGIK